jgi:hypothetical protein
MIYKKVPIQDMATISTGLSFFTIFKIKYVPQPVHWEPLATSMDVTVAFTSI